MRRDPVHCDDCSPDVAWSTVNAGEALPGVVTPLTWSFFGDPTDRAIKQTFCDLGVIGRDEVHAPPRPERRMWDTFYGRAAGNLNMFRRVGDRMPGTSGDAIEQQIFGQVRPGVRSRPEYLRYPIVAVKMPIAAVRVTSALERAVAPVNPWWRRMVAQGGLPDAAVARAAVREAMRRFEAVMVPHTLAAMLCQASYEQLRRLAEAAGRPGLELSLITGYGQMAETDVVADLWDVSRNRLSLDEFVARHGYHGPDEGELSSRVWRLDREPLVALLESYRAMPDERDPRLVERRRARERAQAEAELYAALPLPRRAVARVVVRIAAKLIPLRGVGKAAFLQCVDVAREAARVIRGEDAFMLTVEELLEPPEDAARLIADRRAAHDFYRQLDIPDLFDGVPEPFPVIRERDRAGDLIVGTPVSPGMVAGVARVMLDPHADGALEPGEILVCRTTDPSWVSLMMLASALVIDIGGAISHGAIVARELGIPCVIGTRDASARIRTGDRLRVDGATGEVRIVQREATPVRTNEPGSERAMATDELPVLRALRLKGRASAEEVAAATGEPIDEVTEAIDRLVSAGGAKEMRGAFTLLPPARERLEQLLAAERGGVDQTVARECYEAFSPVNDDFKALANDWQTRDGRPNDHRDAVYDRAVLDRLPAIHARVAPLIERAAEQAPRLLVYRDRLQRALNRVQAGEREWLLGPLIDSYHTVWFELHEELISLAGLSRQKEAAAGRAQ